MDNEQFKREIDVLRNDNTRLRTDNDATKHNNEKLTTRFNKMAVDQKPQISSYTNQITQLRDENKQIKVS